MIAARFAGSETLIGIFVPGTFLVGAARNWSSVLASQVSPEPFMAAE
jgi:hypothetical protein